MNAKQSVPMFLKRIRALHKTPPPFFKRHARLISLAGLFIVFSTFVIKEGLSERWKEDGDAIYQAKYIFEIQRHEYDIQATLDEEAHRTRMATLDRGPRTRDSDIVVELLDEANLYRIEGEQRLSHISELMDRLPVESFTDEDGADSDTRTYFTELESELMDFVERGHKFMRKEHTYAEIVRYLSDNKADPVFDEKYSRLLSIVLNQADELGESYAAIAECAWWTAAGLYGLGWLLALIGRVYDVAVSAE